MRHYYYLATVVCLLALSPVANVWGQTTTTARGSGEKPETLVYRISDLVVPTPNYSFDGIKLPGMSDHANRSSAIFGGMGGGMGGMGGGGMDGMGSGSFGGGGFFNVPDDVLGQMAGGGVATRGMMSAPRSSSGFRFTIDDLIEAIVTTIEPASWEDNGGEASIMALGGMLVVNQTPSTHKRITQLLTALRQHGGTVRSVTIRAYWILIERAQLDAWTSSSKTLKRKDVIRLAAQSGATGEITCFDGQTVHLASGNLRSAVTSFIPVVGHVEGPEIKQLAAANFDGTPARAAGVISKTVLAQAAATDVQSAPVTTGRVGYQPVTKSVVHGALLQVTPTLSPDNDLAILDVQSIVIRPKPTTAAPVEFQAGKLDRINLVTQQFMTTLRAPVGQPVVVAGATLEPIAEDSGKHLYLVLEAVAN